MELSNFSSLIELSAGLCVAAVAAEVSQGYIKVLFNKIFKLDKEIALFTDKLIDPISVSLKSVSCISPVVIDGKSTLPTIEKTKIKLEELKNKVDNKKNDIENNVALKCDLKSFTFFNLFNFILCSLLLLVIGLGESVNFDYSLIYAPILIILMLGTAYNSKRLRQNMLHAIYGILIIVILCLILSFIDVPFVNSYGSTIRYFTIPALCLIPFATFIMYFFIIKGIFEEIQKEISDAIKTISAEYEEIKQEETKLFVVTQFSAEIKASSDIPVEEELTTSMRPKAYFIGK